MINLEELQQLAAFGELGTLSKVAEKFHISTPSVTRSMKNIEEAAGVELFNRSKNRIELNENGMLMVGYARDLLGYTDRMLERVREFDQRQRTIVVKSSAPAPLWELMKTLSLRHPGKTVSSAVLQNEAVMSSLMQGDCDAAILPFKAEVPGYTAKKFMTEKLYVFAHREHALAKYEKLHWSEINGFNFLLRTELGFWDALCREKMKASKFLIQSDADVFEEIVRASTLPCFVSDYIIERREEYADRIMIPIDEEEADVTFYLLEKK